jgi:hypothetical protein
MAPLDRRTLLAKFNANPPAEASLVRQFETGSRVQLPEDYATFLHETDGGEGFVGNAYVVLWRISELIELNRAYQVDKYARGLLLFGSNGGGEAFAFDTRDAARRVVRVPFIGMAFEEAISMAADFSAFLYELYKT